MSSLHVVLALSWQPAGHQLRSRRPSHESFRLEMCAEHSARSREIAAEFIRRSTGVDVTAAAATVASLVEEDEQRERTLDALFTRPPAIEGDTHDGDGDAHVWERDALIGQIRSSELLTLDEKAGIWPLSLERDAHVVQMAYVDEAECIGCTYCASIARSTFHMQEETGGVARAVQQGECREAIEEAQASCPVDCIHWVSRVELEGLEEERAAGSCTRLDHFNDQVARTAKRLRVPDLGPSFPGIAQQAAMVAKWGPAARAARERAAREAREAPARGAAVTDPEPDAQGQEAGGAKLPLAARDADLARRFATPYEEEEEEGYSLP